MYSKTIIVGRLTADPELKTTQSGVSVVSFSVAVGRAYAPKGQERQTDFYDVVAWRGEADFICKYFSKGSAILVEGNMESRTYTDKNGQNRRVWELVANNIRFVESKSNSNQNATQGTTAPTTTSNSTADDDDGDVLPF